MTDPASVHSAAAVIYAVPALVWAVLTRNYLLVIRTRLPRRPLFAIFPTCTGLVALVYVIMTIGTLGASEPGLVPQRLLTTVLVVALVALGPVVRHLIVGTGSLVVTDTPTTPAWLAGNYGAGAGIAAVALRFVLRPGDAWITGATIATAGFVVMVIVAGWEMRGRVQRGPLRMGNLATQLTRTDLVILAVGSTVLLGAVAAAIFGRGGTALGIPLAIACAGLFGATALALRNLAVALRDVTVAVVTLVGVGVVFWGARAVAASTSSATERLFVDAGAVLALLAITVPVRDRLRAGIDRVLLRHGQRIGEELQAFLHTLSPELGAVECCRRALAEMARAWRMRGAAILLHDGTSIVEGEIAFEPLRAEWPTGAAADRLPKRPFIGLSLPDVRLRQALGRADVIGVLPIVSPHRRWGHLFVSIGVLGWDKGAGQIDVGAAFCDQLALLLDGAELLARTVAVERSLAHAEKLAAIGELAARIAHDIRNPVTAARSLAQQLTRESGTPYADEHAVILEELERVESRVGALLRFARREEFRFEPVALGPLVRATVGALRARLEAADIGVHVEAGDGITARADAEKLRHVLVNVVENAIDALAEAPAPRRLAVVVGGTNGTASIEVRDSGPGVTADALAHLFEPFFTLKPHGTGLGLAIARRTIDAHGGRITAAAAPGGGMAFTVELPIAEAT